jgi:hypothetical protein
MLVDNMKCVILLEVDLHMFTVDGSNAPPGESSAYPQSPPFPVPIG